MEKEEHQKLLKMEKLLEDFTVIKHNWLKMFQNICKIKQNRDNKEHLVNEIRINDLEYSEFIINIFQNYIINCELFLIFHQAIKYMTRMN